MIIFLMLYNYVQTNNHSLEWQFLLDQITAYQLSRLDKDISDHITGWISMIKDQSDIFLKMQWNIEHIIMRMKLQKKSNLGIK